MNVSLYKNEQSPKNAHKNRPHILSYFSVLFHLYQKSQQES